MYSTRVDNNISQRYNSRNDNEKQRKRKRKKKEEREKVKKKKKKKRKERYEISSRYILVNLEILGDETRRLSVFSPNLMTDNIRIHIISDRHLISLKKKQAR